jgi:hypothetical protein
MNHVKSIGNIRAYSFPHTVSENIINMHINLSTIIGCNGSTLGLIKDHPDWNIIILVAMWKDGETDKDKSSDEQALKRK